MYLLGIWWMHFIDFGELKKIGMDAHLCWSYLLLISVVRH